ncbi:MAG: heavy-metal-associated domain-containing protein [Halanaeroarchaeum sp.]
MTTTLTVTGMSCGHCEQTVIEALESVDGVRSATADNEADQAVVEGEPVVADLIAAVEDAGYEATA